MSVSDTLTGRMRSISISGKTAPLKIDVLIVGGGAFAERLKSSQKS